jgi:hypothetical protein
MARRLVADDPRFGGRSRPAFLVTNAVLSAHHGARVAELLSAATNPSRLISVGVAALSIAMCRAWPTLPVVGLDPFEPALALARQNVAEAGFQDRIALRQIGAAGPHRH